LEAANHLEHNLLAGENQVDNQTTNRRPSNHFFHFDGKYCSRTFELDWFNCVLIYHLCVIIVLNYCCKSLVIVCEEVIV
jgi:hypothetical protein